MAAGGNERGGGKQRNGGMAALAAWRLNVGSVAAAYAAKSSGIITAYGIKAANGAALRRQRISEIIESNRIRKQRIGENG